MTGERERLPVLFRRLVISTHGCRDALPQRQNAKAAYPPATEHAFSYFQTGTAILENRAPISSAVLSQSSECNTSILHPVS